MTGDRVKRSPYPVLGPGVISCINFRKWTTCRTIESLQFGAAFLANVKSRSRSLYVSSISLSLCRLSVCNARAPYSCDWNFRPIFLRRLVPWPRIDIQVKFYGDRPRETPTLGELKPRGVAEYIDFGPMERYISETCKIGVKFVLITNRKSHVYQTRLPWMTLNAVIALTAAYLLFHRIRQISSGLRKKWLMIHRYFVQRKWRPKNLVFSNISFIAILAGDHPQWER